MRRPTASAPSRRAGTVQLTRLPQQAVIGRQAAAVRDVQTALQAAGVTFAIQGSYALAMHGAFLTEPPGDVDFVVDKLMTASQALEKSGKFTKSLKESTFAVQTYVHKATGAKIQLVSHEEFGVPLGRKARDRLGGAVVLSRLEAIKGVILRPEKRLKDILAFASLILAYGDLLSEAEKQQVVIIARRFIPQIKTWDDVVKNAREAWTKLAGAKGAAWEKQRLLDLARRELTSLAMMYGWSQAEMERRAKLLAGLGGQGERPRRDYSSEYIS